MPSNTWNNRNCGEDGKITPSYAKAVNEHKAFMNRFLDIRKNLNEGLYRKHVAHVSSCLCGGNSDLHKKQRTQYQTCKLIPLKEE